MDRPRPVHLDPDRPVLDRRFKRITYEKNQNLMNVVFSIGAISLRACLFDSKIESFEKKKVRKFTKKLKPKNENNEDCVGCVK